MFLVDLQDARLGERAVGQDAHLRAGVALRLDAEFMQRDRQQADGHLFARRGDHVELARIGFGESSWASASSRLVSPLIADTTTDQLMAFAVVARDAPRDVPDALDAADRSAAVFLDDQRH